MDGKRLEKRDWEEREGLGLCEAKPSNGCHTL